MMCIPQTVTFIVEDKGKGHKSKTEMSFGRAMMQAMYITAAVGEMAHHRMKQTASPSHY